MTEAIILGGGIAGLCCALNLHEAAVDFTLVTPDVGGRIKASADGSTQYGAYYVLGNYDTVLPLCSRLDRIWPWQLGLHTANGRGMSLFTPKSLPFLHEAVTYIRELRAFRSALRDFRRRCLTTCQKEAIASDPVLSRLFFRPACDWLRAVRIERWGDLILRPLAQVSTFQQLEALTAFEVLQFTMNLIEPCYRLRIDIDRLVQVIRDRIVFDRAVRMQTDGGFRIDTERSGTLHAANVVVALGTGTDAFLGRAQDGTRTRRVSAFMQHVRGEPRPQWRRFSNYAFSRDDQRLALARQQNGTYLLYSRRRDEPLEEIFERHEVIEARHWDPAFQLGPSALLPSSPVPGLYLAGDHNICGLEDAAITGIYAAHRIVAERAGRSGRSAA